MSAYYTGISCGCINSNQTVRFTRILTSAYVANTMLDGGFLLSLDSGVNGVGVYVCIMWRIYTKRGCIS